MIASRLFFKRIIGVEFARELVAIACRNLEQFGCKAEIVHTDAADYEFPAENLVVYLYNPFGPEVLRPVLSRLQKISTNHEIYLLYVNPRNRECVEEFAPEIATRSGAKVYRFERRGNNAQRNRDEQTV